MNNHNLLTKFFYISSLASSLLLTSCMTMLFDDEPSVRRANYTYSQPIANKPNFYQDAIVIPHKTVTVKTMSSATSDSPYVNQPIKKSLLPADSPLLPVIAPSVGQ
jgi:hypothetical protein